MTLQPGQRITAPFLAAPAEVKAFSARDGYYHLEVVLGMGTTPSNRRPSPRPTRLDRGPGRWGDRSGDDAEDFFLFIEAHRLRLAHQFDPSSP